MRRSARCAASSAPSSGTTANQSRYRSDVDADPDEATAPQNPIDLLDELIGEAADVDVASVGGGFEYSRNGRLFAARAGDETVEVRLGAEIAEAATRTPDTRVSARGADWVRFAPSAWDNHALDRLEAWF